MQSISDMVGPPQGPTLRKIGEDPAEMSPHVDKGLIRVFQILGKRWTGLILAALFYQEKNFSDVRRAIPGISERMLANRLAELVDAGLVVRLVSEGPPLRVSYRVTLAGAALESPFEALAACGRNFPE